MKGPRARKEGFAEGPEVQEVIEVPEVQKMSLKAVALVRVPWHLKAGVNHYLKDSERSESHLFVFFGPFDQFGSFKLFGEALCSGFSVRSGTSALPTKG